MLPYSYYRHNTTGEIISKINDLDIVKDVISKVALSIFIDLPLSIITLIAIYFINSTLFFISLIMLCISMTVASVPECLPIAITATLSIGVSQMAKKKSIVRNLAAIETLGNTEIICSDKTGTLTENKMQVIKVFESGKETDKESMNQKFIDIINYCNIHY